MMACAFALIVAGCSTRSSSSPDKPFEPNAGAGGAATDDDAGDEPAASDPRLECPLARGLEQLVASSCPDLGDFGSQCSQVGARCISYKTGDAWFACNATCDSARKWRVDCSGTCRHACAEPPSEGAVVELDTSDCTRRPLAACNEGALTLQSQLDGQVEALLPAERFMLTDLAGDTLVVQFENGCAKRFFAKGGRALPVTERFIRGELQELRLRCALALECAEVPGP
jgi:hypothetical protein